MILADTVETCRTWHVGSPTYLSKYLANTEAACRKDDDISYGVTVHVAKSTASSNSAGFMLTFDGHLPSSLLSSTLSCSGLAGAEV
jgi:hypothetical protein